MDDASKTNNYKANKHPFPIEQRQASRRFCRDVAMLVKYRLNVCEGERLHPLGRYMAKEREIISQNIMRARSSLLKAQLYEFEFESPIKYWEKVRCKQLEAYNMYESCKYLFVALALFKKKFLFANEKRNKEKFAEMVAAWNTEHDEASLNQGTTEDAKIRSIIEKELPCIKKSGNKATFLNSYQEIQNVIDEINPYKNEQDFFESRAVTVPEFTFVYDGNIFFINNNNQIFNLKNYVKSYFIQEAWSAEEKSQYLKLLREFPKMFGRISAQLKTKSTSQCIMFYYLNQKEFKDILHFKARLNSKLSKRKLPNVSCSNRKSSSKRKHVTEKMRNTSRKPSPDHALDSTNTDTTGGGKAVSGGAVNAAITTAAATSPLTPMHTSNCGQSTSPCSAEVEAGKDVVWTRFTEQPPSSTTSRREPGGASRPPPLLVDSPLPPLQPLPPPLFALGDSVPLPTTTVALPPSSMPVVPTPVLLEDPAQLGGPHSSKEQEIAMILISMRDK